MLFRSELWQWHCRIPFHFSQFQKFFFTPYFGNVIATIAKNLYPLFWQCHCRKLFFFPPIFGNGIATIANFFFSTSFGFPCVHSHFEHPLGQQVWAKGISVMVLLKIKNFSLLLFIFLSPTFVEFWQWYCRNSFSFLRLLNKLKQYL